jgi:GT2 family glycosyltransferase
MRPPIYLADLELSRPLRPIDGLGRFTAAQLLVRLHGEPLGEVTLPIVNGRVTAHAMAEAIRTSLYDALLAAGLRNGLQVPMGPDGLELEALLDTAPAPDDGPTPLVTVAVCTRDRADDLRSCLEAIGALTYPHLDVVVVDNAPSDDRTEALVRSAFPAVRYVREPRPGLDWARNRALLAARGELVAFTDDDVIVDPGWVSAFVPLFTEAPDVMGATGLVLPLELETEAQVLFEKYGGFGRGFRRCWWRRAAQEAAPRRLFHHGPGRFGTGANMAFRRSVFETIGGFDPALDVGTQTTGGGDLEIYFRLLQEGYTLAYEPSALVRHRHRRSQAGLYRQIASWGRAVFAVKARSLRAYPQERRGFRELTRWWRRDGLRRLARSLLGRSPIPPALVWAELKSAWDGAASYRRATADVAHLEAEFGPQPPIPGGDALPSAPPSVTPSVPAP